jgi:ribosome-binding protein aMBF1 (putative translation factor)
MANSGETLLYGCRLEVIKPPRCAVMVSRATRLQARNILATNLRRMRLSRGLSQEELAAIARLHRTYVGSIERAERNVSIDNIEKLAVALGVSLADLVREGK